MSDFKVKEKIRSEGIILEDLSASPTGISDTAQIYSKAGDSSTGVFIKDGGSAVEAELISKKQAITFALVF